MALCAAHSIRSQRSKAAPRHRKGQAGNQAGNPTPSSKLQTLSSFGPVLALINVYNALNEKIEMRTQNSKMLLSLALLALLIETNGCMTQSTIQYAKGRPENAWINNGFGGAGPPADPKSKPHPAYYMLLPLSVPADVVTSPFQLIGFGADCMLGYALAHSGC